MSARPILGRLQVTAAPPIGTPRFANVHRSLREWVARGLGAPPWRVRLTDEIPLTDRERPVAYVELQRPRTLEARAVTPQGAVQRLALCVVSAYPPLGEQPRESRAQADAVADQLDRLAMTGQSVALAAASPSHVPIFDWTGIELDGPAAGRALPADSVPYTWGLLPAGWDVQIVKDPMDPKRFTVGASFTMRWWDAGAEGAIGGESLGVAGSFETPVA